MNRIDGNGKRNRDGLHMRLIPPRHVGIWPVLLAVLWPSVVAAADRGLPLAVPQATSEDREQARRRKAAKELEIVTLQALLGPMLATKSTKYFGTGPAGKHWQSLMTEQLAKTIAANGALRLLPDRARPAPNRLAGSTALGCATPHCGGPAPWQTQVITASQSADETTATAWTAAVHLNPEPTR
ncbi:MAG: hypothetical protein ACKVP7_05220 [Hyphomicrobiaceae bacterium]